MVEAEGLIETYQTVKVVVNREHAKIAATYLGSGPSLLLYLASVSPLLGP